MTSKLVALAFCLTLSMTGQSPDIQTIKTRVRDLQAHEVKVALADGSTLRGRVLRLDEDAFTLQQQKPVRERSLRYAQVKEVSKAGLSRRAKAILIPIAVGGAVLVALCAAPYPIGFLCRKDPS